jgi:hypothetical protein
MSPSAVPPLLMTVAEPGMVLAGDFLLREEGSVVMQVVDDAITAWP